MPKTRSRLYLRPMMNLQHLNQWLRSQNQSLTWIIQVFVVVFAVLFSNYLLGKVLDRLRLKTQNTRNIWDDALLEAIRRPLRLSFWIIGIAFAAEIAKENTEAVIFEAAKPLRSVGVIACVAWFLVRFILEMEKSYIVTKQRNGAKVDRTTVEAVGKLLRISVFITAVLVALQTLGFSISGVLAFGGIGGIAVGFAAKDLLANFFGGIMIYLDRPFEVGDWIRSPDREIEGVVEKIGWRLTCIRAFDKRPIYVPNAVFTTIAVQNPSRMTHRRIYETIGIRYNDSDKMSAITQAIKTMLLEHPEIDSSQTLMVNFNSFAPSSLDFFVYCLTRTTVWTKYHEVKQDILLRIEAIIRAHEAEIAFPTSTIHLPDPISFSTQEATKATHAPSHHRPTSISAPGI